VRPNGGALPRCGVCLASLTESLAYQIVDVRGRENGSSRTVAADNADGDDSVVPVALVYCTSCGVAFCGLTLGGHGPPVSPATSG
jgi:hypothetical protein